MEKSSVKLLIDQRKKINRFINKENDHLLSLKTQNSIII